MRWWWLVLLAACASSTGTPATTPEGNTKPPVPPQMEAMPVAAASPRPSATAATEPPRPRETAVGPTPPPPQPPGATTAATSSTSRIEEELGRLRARLRGCYNAALARQPDLQGSMRWRLSIRADGTVSKASHDCPDKIPPELEQCVTRAMSGLSFPRDGVAYETSVGACGVR